MRIVYCLNSVRGKGGIERVTVVKANALADVAGNEVFVVVTDNRAGVMAYPLSHKVHLINLDVNYYANDHVSKWRLLKATVVKRSKHRKLLADALHKVLPDVVVSVGQSEKYMVADIKGDWKTVREFHYPKNYRKMHARGFFEHIVAFFSDLWDFHHKIWKYTSIVVLTHGDKADNWHNNPRIDVIPNPISFVDGVCCVGRGGAIG